MEDIRTYRVVEDDERSDAEDERVEFGAGRDDDEVPFHVPRD